MKYLNTFNENNIFKHKKILVSPQFEVGEIIGNTKDLIDTSCDYEIYQEHDNGWRIGVERNLEKEREYLERIKNKDEKCYKKIEKMAYFQYIKGKEIITNYDFLKTLYSPYCEKKYCGIGNFDVDTLTDENFRKNFNSKNINKIKKREGYIKWIIERELYNDINKLYRKGDPMPYVWKIKNKNIIVGGNRRLLYCVLNDIKSNIWYVDATDFDKVDKFESVFGNGIILLNQ